MLLDNFSILVAVTDFVSSAVCRTTTQHVALLKTRRTILPLLGERAGVRAAVTTNFMTVSDKLLKTINIPHLWCCQSSHSAFLWLFWRAAATKPLNSGCGWCGLL
jgi:hypothetical protein